jgi:hypothetical protein
MELGAGISQILRCAMPITPTKKLISRYRLYDERIMNGKACGRKRQGPDLRYHYNIFFKGLQTTTKKKNVI